MLLSPYRFHPASSSRCLVLARNSRCLRRLFPLWSWTSLTFCLKVANTAACDWCALEVNMIMCVCVFQGLSSVCCVETWPRKSAATVSKTPFLARQDSNCSVRRVQLRCVCLWRYFVCVISHVCCHIYSAALRVR